MVKLPGGGEDASKDICGDKCLLRLARERAGSNKSSVPRGGKIPGLSEFLTEQGVKPAAKGALSAQHVRRRHEMNGGVEDCLVCEYLTREGVSV